jgi:DNA modification methylase
MLLNRLFASDCNDFMDLLPGNFIDLTVTSPPYDKLRKYEGFEFEFEKTATNLFRVTKDGAVLVWVVGDQTIKGSETGNSFRQALFFLSVGFKLHDTMIWDKKYVWGTAGNPPKRYQQAFEYVFVFVKGKLKTFNPIKIDCIQKNVIYSGTTRRDRRGSKITNCLTIKRDILNKDQKIMNNIFTYPVGFTSQTDKSKFKHPAIFPFALARDQITSWSKPLDLVFDPFSGSGTTCEEAKKLGRFYLGCDVSSKYIEDSEERLSKIEDHTIYLQ